MSLDLASERSAVVAIYSNRRDAEIAIDQLQSEGLDAFLSADDAGGMHPHLQETHGVRVLVLEKDVSEALTVLEEAGLLSEADSTSSGQVDEPRLGSGGSGSARGTGSPARDRRNEREFPLSVTGGAFVVILIVIVLALLVLALMPG